MKEAIFDLFNQFAVVTIPIAVPFVVAVLKKGFESMPKWAIPLTVPILGVVGAFVLNVAGVLQGDGTSTTLIGAVGGALGLYLREVWKQVTAAFGMTSALKSAGGKQ